MDVEGETLVEGEVRDVVDVVGELCGDREMDAEADVVEETELLELCFELWEFEGVDEPDEDSRALEDCVWDSGPEREARFDPVVDIDERTVPLTVELAVPHLETLADEDEQGDTDALPEVDDDTVPDTLAFLVALVLVDSDADGVAEREKEGECVVELDCAEDAERPADTVCESVESTEGGGEVYAVIETDAVTEFDTRGLRLGEVLLESPKLDDPRADAEPVFETVAEADVTESVACGLTVPEPHGEDDDV